jgi:hypothetical protein
MKIDERVASVRTSRRRGRRCELVHQRTTGLFEIMSESHLRDVTHRVCILDTTGFGRSASGHRRRKRQREVAAVARDRTRGRDHVRVSPVCRAPVGPLNLAHPFELRTLLRCGLRLAHHHLRLPQRPASSRSTRPHDFTSVICFFLGLST